MYRSRVTKDHANQNTPRNDLPADTPAPIRPNPNRHSKLLKLGLSHSKQRTSHFLIDNFRQPFALGFSLTSNFRHPISSYSNRQSPELESLVSYRKQRTQDFLVAKFRHIIGPYGTAIPRPKQAHLDPARARQHPAKPLFVFSEGLGHCAEAGVGKRENGAVGEFSVWATFAGRDADKNLY